MKWMIASDLHGSAFYVNQLLEAYDRESADRLVLLGDILYHGPRNDLPDVYNTKTVFDMLNERKENIISVRGNCDAHIDQVVLDFPIGADYALLDLGTRLAFLTHGHLYSPEMPPALKPGDLFLSGHTHVAKHECKEGVYYCNPGSVSIPKGGTPHSYLIIENDTLLWKNLDGTVYDELKL